LYCRQTLVQKMRRNGDGARRRYRTHCCSPNFRSHSFYPQKSRLLPKFFWLKYAPDHLWAYSSAAYCLAVFEEHISIGTEGRGEEFTSTALQSFRHLRVGWSHIHTHTHDVHAQVRMTNVHSGARCTICILLHHQSPT